MNPRFEMDILNDDITRDGKTYRYHGPVEDGRSPSCGSVALSITEMRQLRDALSLVHGRPYEVRLKGLFCTGDDTVVSMSEARHLVVDHFGRRYLKGHIVGFPFDGEAYNEVLPISAWYVDFGPVPAPEELLRFRLASAHSQHDKAFRHGTDEELRFAERDVRTVTEEIRVAGGCG